MSNKANLISIIIIGLIIIILGFIDLSENEPTKKTAVMILGGAIVLIISLTNAISKPVTELSK